MSKILSILLIVSYMLSLVRPYLPYVEYQIYRNYYAQVLCQNKNVPRLKCNGKCILAQKLEKASLETQHQAPLAPSNASLKDFLTAHIPLEFSFYVLFLLLIFMSHDPQVKDLTVASPPTPPPRILY